MQAAPRYVSVSELYTTDEVELLLDEIRELEPTSCRGEDVQDFEIAGSGCPLGTVGAAGGRSPCGTEVTERSWDSHAHYSRAPPPRPQRKAPLYCRLQHLLTLRGATTFLLFLVCLSACACIWSVSGVRVWRLPLAGRFQLLLLAALSTALVQAGLLTGHITLLIALLPLDWRLLSALSGGWAFTSLSLGGGLSLWALYTPPYRHAAPHQASLLIAAAGLALAGAALGAALLVIGLLQRRRPATEPKAYLALPASEPNL